MSRLFAYWEKYNNLWRNDKEITVRAFVTQGPSLADYDAKLQSYVTIYTKLSQEPILYRIGALVIKTGNFTFNKSIKYCPSSTVLNKDIFAYYSKVIAALVRSYTKR